MKGKRYYVKIVLEDDLHEAPASFAWFGRKRDFSLRDLLRALDRLAAHPQVQTLLLMIRPLSAGWAQIEEIRSALSLRKKG